MHLTLINLPDKHDACEVFNASVFYAEKLMSKRLLAGIEVRVVFVPGLEKKYNLVGDCGWQDDNIRPREFMIRLDADMGRRKMLISLAHELVHVKQYAKSEMRDLLRCGHTRWHRESIDTDDVNYWDLPWEIEAHGREVGLYERFKKHWWKEKKNAKAAYKAQPDCAGTPHTLVLKEGSEEQEDV